MSNILVPSTKDNINTFFDEILIESSSNFIFGDLKYIRQRHFDGILFQWPESIFNWTEPTLDNLLELEQFIETAKELNITIYYLVHNLESHGGFTNGNKKLYDIVINAADVCIHMGNYSCNLLKSKYKKCQHVVIPHPLYSNSYPVIDTYRCREKLNISTDAKVVFCPGKVRNKAERDMIYSSFNQLKIRNKVLIAPRMIKLKSNLNFRGITRLKKIIDIKSIHKKLLNTYWGTGRVISLTKVLENKEYAELLGTADVVFIARELLLNSGGVFAGLTMRKVVVGPGVGNLTEVLQEFGFPIFDPNKRKEIVKALQLGFLTPFPEETNKMDKYNPKQIAKQYDELFSRFNQKHYD